MKLKTEYPPANKGTVVVWSLLAALPFSGTMWHRLQYLAGLKQLGFDVWYVEDSDRSVMSVRNYAHTVDYLPNVEYLARHMKFIGLSDRWVYRPPGQYKECLGALSFTQLLELYRQADAVINHSGAQDLLPHHEEINFLVFLETDPVVNQVSVAEKEPWIVDQLSSHQALLTYAANLNSDNCLIPVVRFNWIPTRPAIITEWWSNDAATESNNALTTIATWKHSGKDVRWQEHVWRWSKRPEFLRFLNLPQKANLPLEIAIEGIGENDKQMLKNHGWRTIPARKLSTIWKYRDYIQCSLGEFTISKEQYVASRSGWFSDRSATYLAAGKPVVTQDTGFGSSIPTGEGLFAFSTEEEALNAIDAIAGDYNRHAKAACEIAHEYFSSDRVISDSLIKIGLR